MSVITFELQLKGSHWKKSNFISAFLSVSLLKRLPYIASHVDHSVLFENISSYAEEGEIKRKDL